MTHADRELLERDALIILGMIIYIGKVVEDSNHESHRARIR